MGEQEVLLKISIMGVPNELRNKLARSYAEGKFDTNYLPTLGVDLLTHHTEVDGQPVLQILANLAGQEFFVKDRPKYIRGSSGVIIIFDKSDHESFKAARGFYNEFKRFIPDPEVPIVFIGIETGSEVITTKEGQTLARVLNGTYYEMKPIEKRIFASAILEITRIILESKK
ncbi:MAG: hypothetical protein ACFFCU_19340 [Promethearchaeota archaeon]